jgi:Dual specificity phosphatase, catalytic domain
MDLIPLDERGQLFISPSIDDWQPIEEHGITAVIDLDGDVDLGIPSVPNHMLYIYFPVYDEGLPDLNKLHALARLAAQLVASGEKVLAHCGMGFNRSALIAGLVLTYLGMKGADALALLREKRPGALFNENFAKYLAALPPHPSAPSPAEGGGSRLSPLGRTGMLTGGRPGILGGG